MFPAQSSQSAESPVSLEDMLITDMESTKARDGKKAHLSTEGTPVMPGLSPITPAGKL